MFGTIHIQIFVRDQKTRGNSVAEAFGVAFFFVSFIIAMLTCLTALALWWWNGLSSWRFWSPESFGENVEISSVFPTTLPGFCTIQTVGWPSNFWSINKYTLPKFKSEFSPEELPQPSETQIGKAKVFQPSWLCSTLGGLVKWRWENEIRQIADLRILSCQISWTGLFWNRLYPPAIVKNNTSAVVSSSKPNSFWEIPNNHEALIKD